MARWIIIALLFFPNIALGGVYVSGGVDPVEIGRRIAVSSPGVITLASGAVTLSNMKLSAVNGTAFVDFSTANVLTDYIPYKGKLTITDSAGKKLIGYIKAQGTGETYGSELITNGNMETGDPPTGWTYEANTSASSVAGDTGQALRTVAVNPDGSHLAAWQKIAGSEGELIIVGLDGKAVSSPSVMFVTRGLSTDVLHQSVAYTSDWSNRAAYINHTGSADLRLRAYTQNNGEGHFDNGTARKVLTPSVTGVTITSTTDGTTYNWASQESGFNYNDASGYTYAITTR